MLQSILQSSTNKCRDALNKGHATCYIYIKLEYLAVYGRASMSVPVGELQYGRTNGTVLDGHVHPQRNVIGQRLGLRHNKNFFVMDRNVNLSRVLQRARGATKNIQLTLKVQTDNRWTEAALPNVENQNIDSQK